MTTPTSSSSAAVTTGRQFDGFVGTLEFPLIFTIIGLTLFLIYITLFPVPFTLRKKREAGDDDGKKSFRLQRFLPIGQGDFDNKDIVEDDMDDQVSFECFK